MRRKLRKYKVRLEYRLIETIEVDAYDEASAEAEAMKQVNFVNMEHVDTSTYEIES